MFDTMKVAKTIRMARINRNMTQMDLADTMGVSYQAVSNWERGNSMPDISKLEDLCGALQISLEELLGVSMQTQTVSKVLHEESSELTVEELAEVAPMLPPEMMKDSLKGEKNEKINTDSRKKNLDAIVPIAPFLDADILEELLQDVEIGSLKELASLAPFLDDDFLGELALKAPGEDVAGIISIAPFLDEDVVDALIARCVQPGQYDGYMLSGLAPFASGKALGKLALNADITDLEQIGVLAPFLDEKYLDALVDKVLEGSEAELKAISGLAPFLGSKTLRKIVKKLLEQGDMDGIQNIAPFM